MSTASTTWRDWSCAVTITVSDGRHLDGAADVVRRLMAEVDQAVSRFRADSDLMRVNDHAGRLVLVSPLTIRLVQIALDAARATHGAVDPTIGSDLLRLGYDDDIAAVRGRRVPAPIGRTPLASWRAVAIDRVLNRVGIPAGMRLDLGATAKAWAADEAARQIQARYGGAVLVGIGGDLSAAGTPGREWRVDVAETEGGPSVRIGLSHGGIATSSTLGRRWTSADGTTLHHVVDPRSGLPTEGRWRTATVWAPTALAANVISTWSLVDAEAAERNVVEHGRAARLIGDDGRITLLGAWPADRAVAS